MTIQGDNNRYRTYDSLRVEKIAYDDKNNISGLAIWNNSTGKRCFKYFREGT